MKNGLGAFRKVRGELPAYLRELGIEIGEGARSALSKSLYRF